MKIVEQRITLSNRMLFCMLIRLSIVRKCKNQNRAELESKSDKSYQRAFPMQAK